MQRPSYGAIDVHDPRKPASGRNRADPFTTATVVSGIVLASVALLAGTRLANLEAAAAPGSPEHPSSRLLVDTPAPAPSPRGPKPSKDNMPDDIDPDLPCSSNSFKVQWCGTGDNNCKYSMRPNCLSKFQCPAGSYCNAGAYAAADKAEAQTYFEATYWPAYRQYTACNVVTSNIAAGGGLTWFGYACVCNPGFYCPENIALPRFCMSRWECKTPSQTRKCPKNHYCLQGTVEARKCTFGQDCKKHIDAPQGGAFFLLWMFIIIVCAYIGFLIRDRYKDSKRERINLETQDYYDVLHSKDEAAKEARASADDEFRGKLSSMKSGLPDVEDGYRIEFSDLRLTLPGGATVMRGPSGALECGKSTAIMGASGAGKTTIMNLITGKVKKTGGIITVNGEEVEDLQRFKQRTAFVPQEDIMLRELTVLDNITFSANMRLPANWTTEMKREKVMEVLCTLGLTHVQHSIIGDEFERGISGGQRKRVNVGLELVADPKILFLDEPTSGLDSVSATKLCKILRDIAEKQRLTVAAVIHSPGPEAFMSFHNFLLLQTGGRLVYYGPMPKVEQYFEDIGFKYPRDETLTPLADHVLLKVSGEGDPSPGAKIKLKAGDTWDHLTGFTKLWHIKQGLPAPADDDEAPEKVSRAEAIKASLVHAVKETPRAYARLFCPGGGDPDRPSASGAYVFYICFRRACRQNYTSFKSFFLGVVCLYIAIGFVLGALFTAGPEAPNVLGGYPLDICRTQYPELQGSCLDLQSNDYVTTIMTVLFIFIALSAATSASTFGCEKPQYWRECSVGLNTPAYFFAKVAADMPLCFVSIFALWAPFAAIFVTPMAPGDLFVALWLLNIFGYFSGYFISFFLPYRYCGLAAVAWSVWWGILFCGITLSMHSASQLKFLFYISPCFWFMNAYFNASTYHPYKRVREGRAKGEAYFMGVTRYASSYSLLVNFSSSLGWLILINFCLLFLDLWIITTTNMHKKK
mmetsp:Transcript_13795/g.42740  ORF Transcript_13795/g.42740 Transcript_13795/m.42740 type:complete len:976 (-) Transcript_13795:85-3012(-)